MNPVTEAIEIIGLSPLAAKCGVTYQAVRKWEASEKVPPARVLQVYRAIGGAVSPYCLNPDVYPDPEWVPPLAPPVDDDQEAA